MVVMSRLDCGLGWRGRYWGGEPDSGRWLKSESGPSVKDKSRSWERFRRLGGEETAASEAGEFWPQLGRGRETESETVETPTETLRKVWGLPYARVRKVRQLQVRSRVRFFTQFILFRFFASCYVMSLILLLSCFAHFPQFHHFLVRFSIFFVLFYWYSLFLFIWF